jgi:hypothetical protein
MTRPSSTPTTEPEHGATTRSAIPRGACFGFGIRSPLPFTLLRKGSGDPLEIVERDDPWRPTDPPLLEWLPRSDRPLHARLYADGDSYRLWTDREGWFSIDPASRLITAPPSEDPIRREERLLSIPLLLCFLARGDLPLHAAVVQVDRKALLLAAPGHFGKTTLASAFLMAGHRVLSEDIACCRPTDLPTVLPGPAMLRVRTASHERLSFPATRALAHEPGRVHLGLEGGARGTGEAVRLAGIIFLRSGEGAGHLERVATERALPDLWTLSLKLPTDADYGRCFEATAALADAVPIWNLYRALRFETLPKLVERIVETCLGSA